MECLYIADVEIDDAVIVIEHEEFRHLRALRCREGERILVSNGRGHCFVCRVTEISQRHALAQVHAPLPRHGESSSIFHLAIGNLDNRERSEFVLEKAVELGVTGIGLVNTKHSSARRHSDERIRAKVIAAMKQCKRSVLPTIEVFASLSEALQRYESMNHIICDPAGTEPSRVTGECCLWVGPEGGFDEEEIRLLSDLKNSYRWFLGSARLRAETAAIAALSHCSAWSA